MEQIDFCKTTLSTLLWDKGGRGRQPGGVDFLKLTNKYIVSDKGDGAGADLGDEGDAVVVPALCPYLISQNVLIEWF